METEYKIGQKYINVNKGNVVVLRGLHLNNRSCVVEVEGFGHDGISDRYWHDADGVDISHTRTDKQIYWFYELNTLKPITPKPEL